MRTPSRGDLFGDGLADQSKQRDKVGDDLAARYPRTGPPMDNTKTEVVAFAGLPREH